MSHLKNDQSSILAAILIDKENDFSKDNFSYTKSVVKESMDLFNKDKEKTPELCVFLADMLLQKLFDANFTPDQVKKLQSMRKSSFSPYNSAFRLFKLKNNISQLIEDLEFVVKEDLPSPGLRVSINLQAEAHSLSPNEQTLSPFQSNTTHLEPV